jgi:hypothetical protein
METGNKKKKIAQTKDSFESKAEELLKAFTESESPEKTFTEWSEEFKEKITDKDLEKKLEAQMLNLGNHIEKNVFLHAFKFSKYVADKIEKNGNIGDDGLALEHAAKLAVGFGNSNGNPQGMLKKFSDFITNNKFTDGKKPISNLFSTFSLPSLNELYKKQLEKWRDSITTKETSFESKVEEVLNNFTGHAAPKQTFTAWSKEFDKEIEDKKLEEKLKKHINEKFNSKGNNHINFKLFLDAFKFSKYVADEIEKNNTEDDGRAIKHAADLSIAKVV